MVFYPFWIINNSLIILIATSLISFYFFMAPIPQRKEIEVRASLSYPEKRTPIDTKDIYEKDLFNTYSPPLPSFPKISKPETPLPSPPQAIDSKPPAQPLPQFLDPLNISLRGIVAMNHKPSLNRATIEDLKTGKEHFYKVGDQIEDGAIIKIFSKKVIILRNNGQQEILYLQEQDAKSDPVYAETLSWSDVLKKIGEDKYQIDPVIFTKRISSLSELIDELNLTTSYKEGKSVGVRIGQLANKSLGKSIDFKTGDTIFKINNIPIDSMKNKKAAYELVINSKPNDIINIALKRDNADITITIELNNFTSEATAHSSLSEQKSNIHNNYNLAPTLHDIEKKELKNMMLNGNNMPHTNKKDSQ